MIYHFLTEARKKLDLIPESTYNNKLFIGLDGFVDLIQRVVKSKNDTGTYYFEEIKDFARHIERAAGKSSQFELETQETKLGGSAPIMAHAMGALGFSSTCLGNFGQDSIQEVFKDIHKNVQLLSVSNSGLTNAMEFHDGKLIFSDVSPFQKLDWNEIKNRCSINALIKSIDEASLIALVDWGNLPYATDIWKGILHQVMPHISTHRRYIFFDILDPSRRSDQEISDILDVMDGFNKYGKVILGLNENETEKIYISLNRINDTQAEDSVPIREKGRYIYENMSISNVLIHPIDRAISISQEGMVELPGRIVAQPKISTGGGDNFNAGFCFGLLSGFDLESCLILAMACSGSYVQNGRSSSSKDLMNYIDLWIEDIKHLNTK